MRNRLFQRLRSFLPRTRAWWEFLSYPATIPEPAALNDGLRTEFPSAQQVLEYQAAFPRAGFWRHFVEVVQAGGVIGLVWHQDQLVFRSCVRKGPTSVPMIGSYTIDVAKEAFYIEYCETNPRYRGQGTYGHMLAALQLQLFERHSARAIMISTDVGNIASARGILRAGFGPIRILMVGVLCGRLGTRVLHEVRVDALQGCARSLYPEESYSFLAPRQGASKLVKH